MEVCFASRRSQGRQIQSRSLKQRGCRRSFQPSLQENTLFGCVQHIVRLRSRRDDGAPGISGWLRIVYDQSSQCAMARSLLKLVDPPSIVGHSSAPKLTVHLLGALGSEVRVIHQHHHHFVPDIHSLEIIPLALRRSHSITDEHNRRIFYVNAIDGSNSNDINVIGPCQLNLPSFLYD